MLARHYFFIIVTLLSGLGSSGVTARVCGSVTIKNDLKNTEKLLGNCTIIAGTLQFSLLEKTTENDFKNVQFPQLEEVSDKVLFFKVQGLTSIGKLFPNLKLIRGRTLIENYALVLWKLDDLKEIGLNNLQSIEKGNVKIGSCPKLCYVHTVNWNLLKTNMEIWDISEGCPTTCPSDCKGGCWSETDCQKEFEVIDGISNTEKKCPPEKFVLSTGNICVTRKECLDIKFFVYDGQCINNCPRGLQSVSEEEGNCKKCPESGCDKMCGGLEVSSFEILQRMAGCTHINGSLILKVNEEIMAKELYSLSSIREIKGYLKVHRSPLLKNLTFLNNLKVIEGVYLQNNNSLMILENDNLNKLWDWDILNLELKQGNISFHYNHQLCISEIERLAKMLKIKKLTPIEVSRHSNGDQANCGEELELNVLITEMHATNVTISWSVINSARNFSDRYIFYYMENSGFKESESDTCAVNKWKVEVVQERRVNLTRLQPYTNYSCYIITKNDSSLSYSRSENFYFMTLSDDPSFPLDVIAVSNKWDSMEINWNPPSKKNGDLAFYIITGYMEEDEQNFLDGRNFCNSIDFFSKQDSFVKDIQTYTNETCLCEENNNVIKFTDKFKYILYEEEFGKHQEIYKMFKRKATNTKENFGFKVNATETSYTISNLLPFSIYVFYISACNLNLKNEPQCGEIVMVSNRTEKNNNADDIIDLSERVSSNSLSLKWSEPIIPNSKTVAYKIEYERTIKDNSKSILECITRRQHEDDGYVYTIDNIPPGRYRVRVSSISLAGNGRFTEYHDFSISQEGNPTAIATITFVIVLIVLSCVGFFFYFRWKRKTELEKLHLIASINPDYAGPIYMEDEWEIERSNVEINKKLGNGTFGLVYSGYIKDLKLFCAIKTVNDNASMEERVSFLNEASVMKSFSEGNHVVRLLGVVSRGQPPLVLMELMACGDLKNYLRKSRDSSQSITSNEMYRMSIEIADGMAYLSAKKFVHRDLAARNCMVSADHSIKIGDFGMARDIYETDYYRKETKGLLPVRWMAPESLADGVFTSDSDVWSYGVVLWEIATLAEQPYQGFSNEQVFDFVIAHGTLTRPLECPDLLYEIMQVCWKWRPINRPLFSDIVKKLEKYVGQDFQLVSFYHSREGEDYRINSRERPINPPAMSLAAGHNLFARYNPSDDEVSIYSGDQTMSENSMSYPQPQQRHLSAFSFKEGSSSTNFPTFKMLPM